MAICPTTRLEKVLLSTDGSEYSEGAEREAIKLAKSCSSKLSVLSVVETNPEYEALAPAVMEKAERTARQYLTAFKTRADREGVDCDIVIREGEEPYRVIVDEAGNDHSSLIVMGRKGRTGLKLLVMGSVTARVIGYAPCNILVVPKDARLDFKSILVATDGSPSSSAAASEAVGLAKRNNSMLTVVSVVPSELLPPLDLDVTVNQRELIEKKVMHEAEKNAATVKEAAQKEGVAVRAFVLNGKPAEAIIETAKERRADLIVVGSHGRTGVERLLMGSVAERVIVLASSPVLVVKMK